MNNKIIYLILGIVVIIAVSALVFALQKTNITQKAPAPEEPVVNQKIQEPTITEPSIKIISPNGGEKWMVGNTYDIAWKSVGVDEVFVTIVDYEATDSCRLTYESVSAAKGKYSYKIVSGRCPLFAGDKLKIKVWSGEIEDVSNDYFSIVEK